MDSDDTTPTTGSGGSEAGSPNPARRNFRKILFDDLEVEGEVVFSRAGVIVQVDRQVVGRFLKYKLWLFLKLQSA